MLSKTAVLILGVIADEPINPYALSKLINFKRKNLRGNIPDSSLYGIISMLEKKKLIKGKRVKNGNMPDRTIYSITPKGQEVLKKNLLSYLSTPEDTISELQLSLFLMGLLEKDQVLNALKEYKSKQAAEIDLMEQMVKEEKLRGVPYSGMLSIGHILRELKSNLKTANAVIRGIRKETGWDHRPVPFWRTEFSQQRNSGDDKRLSRFI
jgi:DNA-binding PadR family transcriptional regulator